MKKKIWAAALALTLVAGIAVGGTVAWLIDETQEVTNTFSPSTINITLTETTATDGDDDDSLEDSAEFKMVPGATIEKDPKVTVLKGSEACWLFVKIDETNNFDAYMEYTVITGDDGWTELTGVDGVDGVYYRVVVDLSAESASDKEFYVLAGDDTYKNGVVTVKGTVTKEQMDVLYNADGTVNTANIPALKFTAYAIQQSSFADAAAAWEQISNPTT